MSVKTVDVVLDHSQSRLGQRLTLIAIADEADSYGVAWPSIRRIADRSGLSERQVQRSIRDLVDMGELERRPRHPSGPWPVYRIVLPSLPSPLPNHPAWLPQGGDNMTPPGGDNMTPTTGDKSDTGGRQIGRPGVTNRVSAPLIDPTGPVKTDPLLQAAEATVFTLDGKTVEPAKKTRKRDPLFDALVDVCKIIPGELTQGARGAANRALKELRDVGATPEEITARGARFRQMWPRVTLTPSALAKQWATVGGAPLPVARANGSGTLGQDTSLLWKVAEEDYRAAH